MPQCASDVARALSRRALDVCRHYLSNGQRQGAYWTVGNLANTPGGSLYVRLVGPDHGPGAAGHWTDAATGEHGDLLDLIGAACGLGRLDEVIAEACRFLDLPPHPAPDRRDWMQRPGCAEEGARRLFAHARPIRGTLAETYLGRRGIFGVAAPCLRFHPRAFWRPHRDAPGEPRPALLAAATDLAGDIRGLQRTWLAPDGSSKAAIETPRRALGALLGHGVRFGAPSDTLAAGEGIESVLSLVMALPRLPVIAGLSANHLAALVLPPGLRRLYIARDNDLAGELAALRLRVRAQAVGLEVIDLVPDRGDFNDDLMAVGPARLLAHLRPQMVSGDLAHFG